MTKKHRIRIGIIVAIVCVMCFSDWGFAAENSELRSLTWLTTFLANISSWGWILLAKLAGEFLTNKRVYGELLGLDALFWQYRNFTKNIANFCLGFYFVYIIFRGLIDNGKENLASIIKNKILRILIAGIGIQVSWFFTAAMVDVSTITLVGAGSLPAQVISGNGKVKWSYDNYLQDFIDPESQKIMFGKYVTLFNQDTSVGKFIKTVNVPLADQVDEKQFFDALMPSADTASGPLYYIGFAILEAYKTPSIDSSSEDGSTLKGSILNLIIMCGTSVVYALEMFVFCVLALMRIIYLWMFIVLSPLAIFLWCLQMAKDDKVLKWSFVETLTKQINIKSFLINIFKPTIIVIGLGLTMIFVSLIKGVIIENTGKPLDLGGIVINTQKMNGDNSSEDEFFTSTMEGGVIKFTIGYVGKSILDFVMSIITVVLVYLVINFAVKMGEGKDFVSEKLKSVQKATEGLLTSLPVMPVAGYDKEGMPTTRYMNVGQVFGVNGSRGLLGERISQYQGGVSDEIGRQNQIVGSWFGDKTGYLTAGEKQAITRARTSTTGTSLDQLKAMKNSIPKDENGKGMKLDGISDSSKFWIGEFEEWLKSATGLNDNEAEGMYWKEMKDKYDSLKGEKTMKGLFDGQENLIKTYVNYFNLDNKIKTWDQLKEADISKKKEE